MKKIMILKRIDADFSVCKVADFSEVDMSRPFCFTAKTDEENSVVCQTEDVPANTTERDDGWKGFRIEGVLDFSLIGILSKISGILADNKNHILRKGGRKQWVKSHYSLPLQRTGISA